ncbi:DNA/RNA non-specific endonuclease [uncultured Bacteroides sp.]|uniref:DNA/RNA non-specific endonuclease n=1 Tax=uncultured Bacteroides sp. TaxID=162156 RepID=UPI00280AF54F|nr:DNA/RNA non-specific endonuclease [uncultured Bacteroides sp.]
MNRTKKGKNRRLFKKKSRSNYKLGYIIVLIVLIPIIYGVYLYYQQTDRPKNNESQTNESLHFFFDNDLQTPISLIPRQEQIIHHTGYIVSYNKDLKLPNWVSYELTREETKGKEKRSNRFITDPLVKGLIATNADYARSRYDKGHMAPAADMKWSPQAMEASFYFSNICPQHPQLNRRGWKKLEEKIRDWAIADSAIIIICGPIITKQPKTIGKNKVAVPQQFFKVVLSPFAKPMRAIGFLFNNRQAVEPLSTYAVTIDSIERLTNMDFFAPLPDEIENKIEAEANYFQWPN